MAALVLVVLLVFGRPAGHFLDTAALLAAIAIAVGGGAVAAVLAFVAFGSIRRRRAAAGGCVGCRFQCQHAMTEQHAMAERQPRQRLLVVSTVERGAPRWPDRPAYRSGPASRPVPVPRSRERAGVLSPRPG
jgi:hypothetical protein